LLQGKQANLLMESMIKPSIKSEEVLSKELFSIEGAEIIEQTARTRLLHPTPDLLAIIPLYLVCKLDV
jgi:hypothetical protein